MNLDATIVIKAILQYLRDNNLQRSFRSLQEETGVSFAVVEDVEQFKGHIINGEWDIVFNVLRNAQPPPVKLISLYEQVILELIEMREFILAKKLLVESEPMIQLKKLDIDRYLILENAVNSEGFFNINQVYGHQHTTESRRSAIAAELLELVESSLPNQLLKMIGENIKISNNSNNDDSSEQGAKRLKSSTKLRKDIPIDGLIHSFEMDEELHDARITSINFSYNGETLYLGTNSGILLKCGVIEHKPHTAYLSNKKSNINYINSSVNLLALGFSGNCIEIISRSQHTLVQSLICGNDCCATSINFSKDESQVLVGTSNGRAIIFGMKSGKQLRCFDTHLLLPVIQASFTRDHLQVLIATSNGQISLFDVKDKTLSKQISVIDKNSVNLLTFQYLPNFDDLQIAIFDNGAFAVINSNLDVIKLDETEKAKPRTKYAALSYSGEYIYLLKDKLYCKSFAKNFVVGQCSLASTSDKLLITVNKQKPVICIADCDKSVIYMYGPATS